MTSYTTINTESGCIIYDPLDDDTQSFSDHINNELMITTVYADIEHQETDNNIYHHVYKAQPYDTSLLVNGIPYNLEIKNDDKSQTTGNLYFEFEDHKGEPSGYKTSTAWQVHYWLILSGNNLYRLTAHKLYEHLDNNNYKEVITWKYKGGKRLISSKGKIAPIRELLEKEWCTSYYISDEALSMTIPNEYREIFG